MVTKELLDNVNKLGVPLVVPEEEVDVNKTLADVVKSKDVRLWENFPVLLASAQKHNVDLRKVNDQLASPAERQALDQLVMVSTATYGSYQLSFVPLEKNLEALKNTSEDSAKALKPLRDAQSKAAQALKPFQQALAQAELLVAGVKLSTERLKAAFEDYLGRVKLEDQKQRAKNEELSLEYALSQVFSPKQKELFNKKLNHEPLTKTEREYFSRAVKKKVAALANDELHSLARKVLE